MPRMFAFKFNLGPEMLNVYDNDMRVAKEQVIPSALDIVFLRVRKEENYYFYELRDEYNEIISSPEYTTLLDLKERSIELYETVLREYTKTGAINYSTEYMNTRADLKDTLTDIVTKYPALEAAFNRKITSSYETYSEVKMNAAYISKALKIEKELEIMSVGSNDKLDFIYDSGNENIYIEIGSEEKDTLQKISSIEHIINTHSANSGIGEINIRPIYSEEITIKPGKYSTIEIETVFPNGSAKERYEARKYYKDLNAKKIKQSIESEKGEHLNVDAILDSSMQEDAKSGYLSITSRGKNIIKTIFKVVNIDI